LTSSILTLVLTRCDACHTRYLPSDSPCPKCGSLETQPYPVPDVGRTVAVTELAAPAPGWIAPHRLALLEVADGVRVLAVVDGPLPQIGEALHVHLDGEVYRTRADPATVRERGEGESPKTRHAGPSFEPPR
jgi:uncharacterized OB-fold protein